MTDPERDATRSQVRGSSLLLAGQAFALIAALVAQVLIVRYLSKDSFGAFAYALSIVMIGEAVAAFGMRRGVGRYMPIYEEAGDLARAAGTLLLAAVAVLSLGIAVVLVVIGLRGAVAGSFDDTPGAVTVIAILIALAPIQAAGTLLDGVFAVFERPRAIVARRFVITPLARLAVVVLLVTAGEDVVFLAIGYVVTGALGIVLYAPMIVRELRVRGLLHWMRPQRAVVPAREVLSFTVPLLSNDVTNAMLAALGGIVLGVMAAPGDVADFRAVLPLVLTMGYVLSSFGLLLVPLAARMFARGDRAELNHLYWRTAVWTGVLAFPVFLACVVVPEPIVVGFFGERYADAAPVLAVLALGQFVNTAAGHNGVLLGVFRRVRFIVLTNVAAVALTVVLMLLLVPRYDAVGAAIATSATFVALNVVRQIGLGRHTDVRGIMPAAARCYGAMTAVTVAAAGVQLGLSPPLGVSLLLVAAGSVAVLVTARRELALAETFPELARIPGLRTLIGTGGGR